MAGHSGAASAKDGEEMTYLLAATVSTGEANEKLLGFV
jgi:hypothetical protein